MSSVRVLAFNVAFLLLTVVLGLAGLFVRACRPDLAFGLARFWTSRTVALLRLLCGVRVAVIGREHLTGGGLIVASQHRSALDALIWFTLVDRPSYVVKRELCRIPLVGPLLEPAGMIAVDRSGGANALRRMVRAAGEALADGRQLVIFPEGTRVASGSDAATLAPGIAGITGVAGAGVPVVPVATDSDRVWGASLLLHPPRTHASRTVNIVIEPSLPDRLGRQSLIGEIKAAWTRAERRFT